MFPAFLSAGLPNPDDADPGFSPKAVEQDE